VDNKIHTVDSNDLQEIVELFKNASEKHNISFSEILKELVIFLEENADKVN
jgi:NADPH-dependent 7-cyano-7-deazaguanine reductase QueF